MKPSSRARSAYCPPLPTETVLYRLVRQNLESFLAYAREHYDGGLPRYVERELRGVALILITRPGEREHGLAAA